MMLKTATVLCLSTTMLVALLLGGCTNANQRLNAPDVPVEHRRLNDTRAQFAPSDTIAPAGQDDDGWFVGIAISGGGSRSANFSAACMFQLQRLGLLQHVDYISSVSGGSLTAAYYCSVDDDAWNPATVQNKLTHSFATDVMVTTFLPWNLMAMLLSHWDRSDVLADSFDKHLFAGPDGEPFTYADLRPDRPRLLINATDFQSGRPFVFSNQSFDALNSDLSAYPLSRAVAASSAVPVVLHHVTLRDYSTIFKQYRHLLDGGISDNLGVKTLAQIYDRHVAQAAAGGADLYPNGAIFIVIDARTQFDARLSDKGDIGLIQSLATGAGLTSTVLLNRASSATLSEIIVEGSPDDATAKDLRDGKQTLETSGYVEMQDRRHRPAHVVHLALSRVDDVAHVPFASFRERVNSIATYFNISETEAYHLYQAADLLVQYRFEPQLKSLKDLIEQPPTARPAAP